MERNTFREVLLGLGLGLVMTSPLQADWCTGDWLGVQWFEMSLSDRVGGAADALAERQSDIQSAITRMRLDTDASHQRLAQRLQIEQQQLYNDTQQLCQAEQVARFPIVYKGANLLGEQQLQAQLRLNLGLYLAHTSVERILRERIGKQQTLSRALEAKFHELSVLSQQAKVSQGPQASVFTANRFVQTVCLAVKASDALLEDVPEDSLESLIGRSLQEEQQAVSPVAVNDLLADCSALAKPTAVEGRSWFSQLIRE